MIVCTSCGHANEADASFCGSCRGFLEWSGERTDAESVPVGSPPAVTTVQAMAPAPELGPSGPRQLVLADTRGGGVHCGTCGLANATDRHYCRSCGTPLADAISIAVPSWWQRLRARVLPAPPQLGAGARPTGWAATPKNQGRRWRPRLPKRIGLSFFVIPLTLLSLVGLGIAPLRARVTHWGFDAAHRARATVAPQLRPVTPLVATASTAQPGHGAPLVTDRVDSTYWSESARGPGIGQRLVLRFDAPVDIDRLGILSGAPGAAFVQQPRPKVLRVTGSDGRRTDVTLADSADLQAHALMLRHVTWVRLQILSVYAGQSSTAAAVREVELFRRN